MFFIKLTCYAKVCITGVDIKYLYLLCENRRLFKPKQFGADIQTFLLCFSHYTNQNSLKVIFKGILPKIIVVCRLQCCDNFARWGECPYSFVVFFFPSI